MALIVNLNTSKKFLKTNRVTYDMVDIYVVVQVQQIDPPIIFTVLRLFPNYDLPHRS